MLLFIVIVVVIFAALVWLVSRVRRPITTVNPEPTNPRQAQEEAYDTRPDDGI